MNSLLHNNFFKYTRLLKKKKPRLRLWFSQPHRGCGCQTIMRLTAVAVIRFITNSYTAQFILGAVHDRILITSQPMKGSNINVDYIPKQYSVGNRDNVVRLQHDKNGKEACEHKVMQAPPQANVF